MNRRILLGGLALSAFIVTLAFSSWHEGLWHTAAAPPTRGVPQPSEQRVMPTAPISEGLTSPPPGAAAPDAAARDPSPAAAPPEASPGEPLYQQNVNPGVDGEAMRRDRGVQHSSGPP